MQIKFLDLKKINSEYESEFKNQFSSFLESGYYILGNNVQAFEEEFAVYCGVENCVGVGNGLDALFLILKAYLELGKLNLGDEVIVSANTYVATILAIKNAGLKPVLVEPSKDSYNLDPNKVSEKLTKKVKAILVTHLYGQLADMKSLKTISKTNNLILISDSAQAHGAIDENQNKAGSLADAAGFSFYPTKNLGALGDAGAITTNDKDLTDCIRKIRNYGTSSKYVNQYIGVNSRLDEIQAGFLRIKLKSLDKDNELRREVAKRYFKGINNSKIQKPYWDQSKNHVFHQFVIQVSERDYFQNYLKGNGIETLIHYPIPPHKQEAFQDVFREDYPITEKMSEEVLSIPLNPVLNENEVAYIIEMINNY